MSLLAVRCRGPHTLYGNRRSSQFAQRTRLAAGEQRYAGHPAAAHSRASRMAMRSEPPSWKSCSSTPMRGAACALTPAVHRAGSRDPHALVRQVREHCRGTLAGGHIGEVEAARAHGLLYGQVLRGMAVKRHLEAPTQLVAGESMTGPACQCSKFGSPCHVSPVRIQEQAGPRPEQELVHLAADIAEVDVGGLACRLMSVLARLPRSMWMLGARR